MPSIAKVILAADASMSTSTMEETLCIDGKVCALV